MVLFVHLHEKINNNFSTCTHTGYRVLVSCIVNDSNPRYSVHRFTQVINLEGKLNWCVV